VPGVCLMGIAVAGLLLAFLVLSGLVVGMALRGRAGPRPDRRRGRSAVPRRPVISPVPGHYGGSRLSSGPNHPDWPLPPRRPGPCP
jgi:hypothetical protein